MPSRVYSPQERAFQNVEHVGIAITIIGQTQHHVGILHKNESTGEVRMLHLAWHYALKDSVPKESYAWVDPAIHRARARQVAAQCRKVWRSNRQGIPYAFSTVSDCFDQETGAYLLGPSRNGLTCATFVLAIFHSVGLPLIQYATHPGPREDDATWQRHIIQQLKENEASPEHVEAVETELPATRYRPEEVAGAAACANLPASFQEAERLGQEIIAMLKTNGLVTG